MPLTALKGRPISEDDGVRIRDAQRRLWDRAASGRLAAQSAVPSAISQHLISEAGIAEGMDVLDMACGTGDPALDIARAVGASGQVVALDISPAMLAIASGAARKATLENVTFRLIESETELDEEPESFEAVTCRFGLMFMPNPLAALKAWTRTLKPLGRIAICTHKSLPAFEVTMKILEHEVPELTKLLQWRQVLSLASTDMLNEMFQQCGLIDIQISSADQSHIQGLTVAECWDTMIRRSTIYESLQALPLSLNRQIRELCIKSLSIDTGRDLASIFSGCVIFASGRKI